MFIPKIKNPAAVMLGSIKTEKKAKSSRINGLLGGYWRQKRNYYKNPTGLNAKFINNLK